MNKQTLLLRIGSRLMDDFKVERDRPEKDYRWEPEYNTAIFNALGNAMADVDSLLWG